MNHLKEVSDKLATKYDTSLKVGKHLNSPDSEFDPNELKMGIEIEKEHTDNEEIAKEIAKDHLSELPDYYTRLKKMEKEGEKDLEVQKGESPTED